MASDLLFRKSKLSSKNWTRHQIASGRYNCLACSFMPEPNPQTWLALYLRCPIPKSCPYSCAPPGPHPHLRPFLIQEVNPLLIIKSSPFPSDCSNLLSPLQPWPDPRHPAPRLLHPPILTDHSFLDIRNNHDHQPPPSPPPSGYLQ